MNNNYNNQPMNNFNNQQPMNNMNQGMPGPQPMMNQPMGNMNPNNGYNVNYGYGQPKPPFKFPGIAKDLPSILGYIGALVMVLGSFMNFATLKVSLNGESIFDESINYFITNGSIKDGFFVILLAIVALILVHFRKNLLALIPTAISGIVLIADVVDTNSKINELKDLYEGYSWAKVDINTSFGPAPFLVGIGIILLIVHVILYIVNKNKNKPKPMNNMYPNNGMNYNQPMNNMNQNMNYNNQPMNNMNQNINYNQNMNQYQNNNNMY